MNNVEWNRVRWGDRTEWEQEFNMGYTWGGPEHVDRWLGMHLLPWLSNARDIEALEIACGMGRFTDRLLRHVRRVHAIDLSEICVEGSRKRFAGNPNVTITLTDGKTLPDGRFGLIVSFDSLVHADIEVLETYIRQMPERLIPGGVAVLHHANHFDLGASRMDVSGSQIQAIFSSLPGMRIEAQNLYRWTEPTVEGPCGYQLAPAAFIDCVTIATRRSVV